MDRVINGVKITYSDKSFNDFLEKHNRNIGEGAYRSVSIYEDNLDCVIKFPIGCVYNSKNFTEGKCEIVFEERVVKTIAYDKFQFEYPVVGISCNLDEACIYINCPRHMRDLLCPVVELIITSDQIPLLVMKSCDNIFEDYLDNGEVTEGWDSKENIESYGRTVCTIMEICSILNKPKEEAVITLNRFRQIINFFELDIREQIWNYGNIGFSNEGNVMMVDYNYY